MDEDYDVIILGTGLKECILSGLLSVSGKKILHMDRNGYYGAESASLNLESLFKKFRTDEAKVPETLGRARDYNVDLCPKFIMACGDLVKVLLTTKVTRYLDFKSINGSFVYKDGKVHKVPATPQEALKSGLMGMFQKRHFRNFLNFAHTFDEEKPETYRDLPGITSGGVTMRQIFSMFKCDDNTIAFAGHALALYLDDRYLDDPAETAPFLNRCQLYAFSVSRYGNSPYIYPMWGLGGLPEGFSRLSAVYGGTYMLNRPCDEVMFDDDGKVCGVKSQGEVARCKQLLCDPSYFAETENITPIGSVARWLFIMSHPIPGTGNSDSCQVIIPARQMRGRRSDIYLACISAHHHVAAQGKFVAMISAQVETGRPKDELKPIAQRLIGQWDEDFFFVSKCFAPSDKCRGTDDGVFITSSYDATTHFQTATCEVLDIYEKMTGQKVDLTISADLEDQAHQV